MRYVDTIDGYGELKGGLIKIKQLKLTDEQRAFNEIYYEFKEIYQLLLVSKRK